MGGLPEGFGKATLWYSRPNFLEVIIHFTGFCSPVGPIITREGLDFNKSLVFGTWWKLAGYLFG